MGGHVVLRSLNVGLKRSLDDDARGSAGKLRCRVSVVADGGEGPSSVKSKGTGYCRLGNETASVAWSESGRRGGVYREDDTGTTLKLLQAADETSRKLQERHGNGGPGAGLRQRDPVLIVEDGRQLQQEMADCRRQSYDVCGARTATDALRIAGTRQIGAVVLDTDMVDMDPFDLLMRMQARYRWIPVILVGGTVDPRRCLHGGRLGAHDYLVKPVARNDLLAALDAAVAARGAAGRTVLLVGPEPSVIAGIAFCLPDIASVAYASPTQLSTCKPPLMTPSVVVWDMAGVAAHDRAAAFADDPGALFPRSRVMILRSLSAGPSGEIRTGRQRSTEVPAAAGEQERLESILRRLACMVPDLGEVSVIAERFAPHVTRLIRVIGDSYGKRLSAEDLARRVGLSRDHLGHLVHDRVGMPLMRCVVRVRYEVARYLIATTNVGLDEVAERAGFWSASHLSRVFLKLSGMRPGEYRASIGSGQVWTTARSTGISIVGGAAGWRDRCDAGYTDPDETTASNAGVGKLRPMGCLIREKMDRTGRMKTGAT